MRVYLALCILTLVGAVASAQTDSKTGQSGAKAQSPLAHYSNEAIDQQWDECRKLGAQAVALQMQHGAKLQSETNVVALGMPSTGERAAELLAEIEEKKAKEPKLEGLSRCQFVWAEYKKRGLDK